MFTKDDKIKAAAAEILNQAIIDGHLVDPDMIKPGNLFLINEIARLRVMIDELQSKLDNEDDLRSFEDE